MNLCYLHKDGTKGADDMQNKSDGKDKNQMISTHLWNIQKQNKSTDKTKPTQNDD